MTIMPCIFVCSTDIIWISLLNFIFCDLRKSYSVPFTRALLYVHWLKSTPTVALALLLVRNFIACETLLEKTTHKIAYRIHPCSSLYRLYLDAADD